MMVEVIGISGPSGSGKTVLTERISNLLGETTVLNQDVFFIDPTLCPPDANFCDPKYLHVSEFVHSVQKLSQGQPVNVPRIDFSTFSRIGAQTLHPSRYLIIEGMTIFRFPQIFRIFDHSFYLALPFSLTKKRKEKRDSETRNKSTDVIASQLNWVQHEYEKDMIDFKNKVTFIKNPKLSQQMRIIKNEILRSET